MSGPWFTIGHSTRTVGELVALLREAGADMVIDVSDRAAFPSQSAVQRRRAARRARERWHPLPPHRQARRIAGASQGYGTLANGFWENASFRNFADYAMGAEFRAGLAELRSLGAAHTGALMCAEAVWWRCHRRIIADYLIAAGEPVVHILAGTIAIPRA